MTAPRVASRGPVRRAVDAPTLREQLEPVRAALREDADRHAALILQRARQAADVTVAEARAESEQAVARAAERATASARARREQARATARREVHRAVLEAEADVRRAIVGAAVAATAEMTHDPRYPQLLHRLEQVATDQLGADAVAVRDPGDGPGVVATAGARRVDYRLATLARRALEAYGDALVEATPEVTS